MSEVQSRPAASRGGRFANRGGRGGFGSRGGTRTRDRPAGTTNGDAAAKNDDSLASLEDEGETGELKKKYGAKVSLIKEMFPDWSEIDVLFALRETDGDENLTVTRIAEGTISRWDEVSKPKKERTKPKPKDTFNPSGDAASSSNPRAARSGGAGPDRTRGRTKTTERGGRASRGRSAQPTNGTRTEKPLLSVPTEESQAWDAQPKTDDEPAVASHEPTPAPAPTTKTPTDTPAPKTWASMLRQSTAPRPVAKTKETPSTAKEPPATETIEPLPPTSTEESEPEADLPNAAEPESTVEEETPKLAAKAVAVPEVAVPAIAVPEVAIPPSKDKLTESNLEHVADTSNPPPTDTIRSEAADSWDPRTAALAGTSTPISAAQQHGASGPAKALGSGYVATAIKATDRTAVRTPSHSRRILDQEEAVRMPNNSQVDRATVQFGALSFSGVDEDIDGDREEPETRTQPPDDSPVAHPRASLPPVAPPAAVPDAYSQKPGVPAALPQPAAASAAPPASSVSQQPPAAAAQAQSAAQSAQQFGRFGQATAQEAPFTQRPFDTYGQSAAQPSGNAQFDSFQGLPASSQPQQPQQQQTAAYTSAPNDYSQYYTADNQNRVPYNYYNQAYGQQAAQGQQDAAANQRSYGTYDSLNQYPQSNATRYAGAAAATSSADAQNSGTSTPNPQVPGQQAAQQPQQTAAQGSHGQQQPQGAQYPYNSHPYYNSPYYAQYVNQYGAFTQGNYGAPYGKGGYGTGHLPYGMSPQTPYDHSASQASGFGAASSLHRGGDSGVLGSSGLNDYSRAGPAQSQSGFGAGGHEGSFGRSAAGYQSQAGQGFGAPPSQASAQQTGDELKPYGDAKGAGGPSPSLGGARPGSATNTQSSQSGLPPPPSSQTYGGYPSHLQGLHGNQSITGGGYGMGAGANQTHANSPYGGYGGHNAHGGQGFGGGSYYGNQQRGWGGNYH